MRIRIKTIMAGPAGAFPAGSVVTVTDEVGAALVASRQAEAVDDAAPAAPPVVRVDAVETAAVEAPENEEFPSRRRRKA